jgi:hypothetical protein
MSWTNAFAQAKQSSLFVNPEAAARGCPESIFPMVLWIAGSMRSLSSGRALRGPVGIAPE